MKCSSLNSISILSFDKRKKKNQETECLEQLSVIILLGEKKKIFLYYWGKKNMTLQHKKYNHFNVPNKFVWQHLRFTHSRKSTLSIR